MSLKKKLGLLNIFLICFIYSHNSFSESLSTNNLVKSYRKAKHLINTGKEKEACIIFKKLFNKKKFLLKNYSLIKQINHCKFNKKTMARWLKINRKLIPKWAEEEFLKSVLPKLKKLNLKKSLAEMLFASASFEKTNRLKALKIQKAISVAQTLKGKKLLRKFYKKLYQIAPRYIKKPTPNQYLLVGKSFEDIRKFKKAISYYEKIIQSRKFSLKEKSQAWDRIRWSYKKQRLKDKYLEETENMGNFYQRKVKKYPANVELLNIYGQNQINLARIYWTRHNRKKAKKIIINLQKKYKNSNDILAQIYWLLGSMAAEAKNSKRAIYYLKQGAQTDTTDKDLADRAKWSLGWNYYLNKNYHKAAITFKKHRSSTENFFIKFKLSYWLGKTLLAQQKRRDAFQAWYDLIDEDHFGYYGILARKELNVPFTPITKKNIKPTIFLPKARWLIAMKEEKSARQYLIHYGNSLYTSSGIEKVLPLYTLLGIYNEGIKLYFKLTPEERNQLLSKEIDLIFPDPYEKVVKAASKRFKISDSLIYSIILQESSFDPFARSWADAYGLMQITPETASVLTKKFKFKIKKPSQLFSPKENILLGASLLRELHKRFKSNFILSVASYNADYKAVKKWQQDRFDGDHIKFIEQIPYEETSNYVKLVIRNFFVYKRLHSKRKFFFPNKFFTNGLSLY